MEGNPAMRDLRTGEISRRVARGRWASIASEFGMLTGSEVDQLVGPGSPPAGCLAAKRQILGVVTRAGRVLYPGFQFDPVTGQARPMIARVAAIGLAGGWKDRHLLQWFCSPNGYLGGDRPVDVLDDPDRLLYAAHSDLDLVW
ncbi:MULTISPECIES: hypothetical protein [unclassified Arthrobacter]|uniref:hypothetical protein n=1 Tax=unclassified Arthrobacter TaxID=235627 RepID=UPI001492DEC5|nr:MULTISPECIES: hypothetical protein [unclassified Arthrobacter]NOJ58731.1 hypothetical protein [Arthrobacter sp. 260]